MRLSTLRRLKREDIREAPEWGGQLLDAMNEGLELFFRALSRQITFQENIACSIRELSARSTSTGAVSLSFGSDLKTRAISCQLAQVTDGETGAAVTIPPIAWREAAGQILVEIAGMTPSTKFNLRFITY
jgi:hypothetical protein